MNRERLLFVAVLAILLLYYFVLRAPPSLFTTAKPGSAEAELVPVSQADVGRPELQLPSPAPFEEVTNERPHPRADLPLPPSRDLPTIWPPTSYAVSLEKLGTTRRIAAPPSSAAATLQLPSASSAAPADAAGSAASAGEAKNEPARVDSWTIHNVGNRVTGAVSAIYLSDGTQLRPAEKIPSAAILASGAKGAFYRTLMDLEDTDLAQQKDHVARVQVQFSQGSSTFAYPDDVQNFRIAESGSEKGSYDGLRWYQEAEGKDSFSAWFDAGQRMLSQAGKTNDNSLYEWAILAYDKARAKLSAADATNLRKVLVDELEAARLLNRQDLVLKLAFEYLERYPNDEKILLRVGQLLESRTFALPRLAVEVYSEAPRNPEAQQRRVALLLRLGRYAEAKEILDGHRAGTGAVPDLLAARLDLAMDECDHARDAASAYFSDARYGAEAHQIAGAAAYVKGDAAGAEREFLLAVKADPQRSTAYSDLGLALAVQGKAEDAKLAFDRAYALDSIDNAVIPRLGKAYLELAAGDAEVRAAAAVVYEYDLSQRTEKVKEKKAEAATHEAAAQTHFQAARDQLEKIRDDNPRDALVQFYLGYSMERMKDFKGAAGVYRGVLDQDPRYRVAIARLGLVLARSVEAGENDSAEKEAAAHLSKAVALNPDDPTLNYILGRYRLLRRMQPRSRTDELLKRAQTLPAPSWDGDLPLWAQAGRAVLRYRDPEQTELDTISAFNETMEAVRQHLSTSDPKVAAKDPVYRYAMKCRDTVKETASKVLVEFNFKQKPQEGSGWNKRALDPMRITFTPQGGGRAVFSGQVSKANGDSDGELESCALLYEPTGLLAGSFWKVTLSGTCSPTEAVDFGVGVVDKQDTLVRGRRRSHINGVELRYYHRTHNASLRMDGGRTEELKKLRGRYYLDLDSVPWPADGHFEITIQVVDHETGDIRVLLNGVDVFRSKFGTDTEPCELFGRGRSSRGVAVVIWVNGPEGSRVSDAGIHLDKMVLTKTK